MATNILNVFQNYLIILWFSIYVVDVHLLEDDKFVTANIFFNMKHLKNASLELCIYSQCQTQGNTSPISSVGMRNLKMRNLRMERISVRI